MELCCSVNGTRRCYKCRRTHCDAHSYAVDGTMFVVAREYICHGCYGAYVLKPYLEKPKEGLTFTELYLAARQIMPAGYISIEVKLQDHRPGEKFPELQWSVYHEKLNHCTGKTPEQALAHFTAAKAAWTDKTSPVANVNI